jgi:hypothetical protein
MSTFKPLAKLTVWAILGETLPAVLAILTFQAAFSLIGNWTYLWALLACLFSIWSMVCVIISRTMIIQMDIWGITFKNRLYETTLIWSEIREATVTIRKYSSERRCLMEMKNDEEKIIFHLSDFSEADEVAALKIIQEHLGHILIRDEK